MTVQVGYSAKTSERSERENAAEKQGQERHLGRTAKPNTAQKTKKGGTAMFEDYYMTADDVYKVIIKNVQKVWNKNVQML